jgi:Arc/MetJ family transcription regulator
MVRTNIVLDDRLVKEVMKLAKARTMREAVDIALRRFVQSRKQKKLLDLYGTGGVKKDYDYKRARTGS